MTQATSLTAHPGRTFEVTLYHHAGTGAAWALTALSGPVALLGESQAPVHPGLPGGAVRQVFTLTGTAPGQASLGFALLRPWEPGQPYDTRAFAVQVEAEVDHDMLTAAGHESFPPLVFASGEDGAIQIDSRQNCVPDYGVLPPLAKYGCMLPPPTILAYGTMPAPGAAQAAVMPPYGVLPG